MAFPKTDQELKEQGYQFQGTSICKGCGRKMEWYATPRGKRIPLDPGTRDAHFTTCPKAKDFRRAR
jgi:hypothetical protein